MIKEIIQSYETPLYRNFCVPDVSKKLMKAGLTDQTVYCWKIRNAEAHLFSFAFDADDYYLNGFKLLQEIEQPEAILPAYSIADIMAALGKNVAIVQEQQYFTVGITDEAPPHEFVVTADAPRLPDALGLLLESCLKEKFIMPGKTLDAKIIHEPKI